MDPEQGFLVIVEYLSVKLLIILLGTVIGMLYPQRSSFIHQFRTFLNLVFLLLRLLILLALFLLGQNLLDDFIVLQLFAFLHDLGFLGICLGQENLYRHEGAILLYHFPCLVLITELQTILI